MFFKTNAPAGANLHGCAATNVWVLQGLGGAVSAAQLPAVAMRTDQSNMITAGTQDFSRADRTLPMKSGPLASLPGACTVGEAYFATDAPSGSNMYGCTGANVWTPQGSVTVKSDDTLVGIRGATNFAPGAGLVTVLSDTGSQIDIRMALDTAVVQTQMGEQSGAALLCASSGGSNQEYQCALDPTAAAYTRGMVLHWVPDVAGAGGATTINVDTLGAVPVKLADGVSDPGPSDVIAGRFHEIWYDGTNFRLIGLGGVAGNSAVATVFGRTGSITAQTGDYTTAQVTESGNLYFTNSRTRSALSGTGPVTFDVTTGTFDCPTCLTTSSTADTDLSGTFPHLSVTGIQGRPVANAAPTDLQYLGWNTSVLSGKYVYKGVRPSRE
ncbi:MAG TPA: hypothetical protein VN442_02550 [Bryobacteraceae bacterium]|nr:hypothetical protein [Bryobacteraceae bacterium]